MEKKKKISLTGENGIFNDKNVEIPTEKYSSKKLNEKLDNILNIKEIELRDDLTNVGELNLCKVEYFNYCREICLKILIIHIKYLFMKCYAYIHHLLKNHPLNYQMKIID